MSVPCVYRWWRQRLRKRVRGWHVFPGYTPCSPHHWPTCGHSLPSRKREGERLSHAEPSLHQHLPAYTAHFAAPAIIDEVESANWDWDWGTGGWGELKRGGRRSWGLVSLPKLKKSKETTTINHMDGLPFGVGLEQNGNMSTHKRFCFFCSALIFYSSYTMTPLELVFFFFLHLLMFCFWCLVFSEVISAPKACARLYC